MYISGEALDQEVVPGYSDVKPANEGPPIYAIKGIPGMVARRNRTRVELHAEMPTIDEDLTEALFRLSEVYDIAFPGIGSLVTRENNTQSAQDVGYVYTIAHIVDGSNMHGDMEQVPFDVTLETVDKILTYYEDMSRDFSRRLYLADLSLRQCIYGRILGRGAVDNGRPHAYFVDYDCRFSNISKVLFDEPRVCFSAGFGGIKGMDNDLRALKENYPDQNFDQIAHRLLQIANHQGIFYKVPTAYYHVEGLSAQSDQSFALN